MVPDRCLYPKYVEFVPLYLTYLLNINMDLYESAPRVRLTPGHTGWTAFSGPFFWLPRMPGPYNSDDRGSEGTTPCSRTIQATPSQPSDAFRLVRVSIAIRARLALAILESARAARAARLRRSTDVSRGTSYRPPSPLQAQGPGLRLAQRSPKAPRAVQKTRLKERGHAPEPMRAPFSISGLAWH